VLCYIEKGREFLLLITIKEEKEKKQRHCFLAARDGYIWGNERRGKHQNDDDIINNNCMIIFFRLF